MLETTFQYYVWWDENPTADTIALWFGSDTATKSANVTITPTGIIRFYGTQVSSLYSTAAGTLRTGGWTRIEVGCRINAADSANEEYRCAIYAENSTSPLSDSGWLTGDLGTLGTTYVRVGKYDGSTNTASSRIDAIAFKDSATTLIGPAVSGGNNAPTANAGGNQNVTTSSTVTLNGTGSSDPDGTIASYQWTQTVGAAVALSNAASAQPTFTAPSTESTLTFSLVVNDNLGLASAPDTVSIVVTAAGVSTPIDDAGAVPIGSANYSIPTGAVYMSTSRNEAGRMFLVGE